MIVAHSERIFLDESGVFGFSETNRGTIPISIQRDILNLRSTLDFGEAPKYNKHYTSIRYINTLGMTPPTWKTDLIYRRTRQSDGSWNGARNTTRISRKAYDTHKTLFNDLYNCVRNNIPFKTNTFEYKPSDQWLYIRGNRVIRHDLEKGIFSEFTYSGVYDKFVNFFLRSIGIRIIRNTKTRKLIWVVKPPSEEANFIHRAILDRTGIHRRISLPEKTLAFIKLENTYQLEDFIIIEKPWGADLGMTPVLNPNIWEDYCVNNNRSLHNIRTDLSTPSTINTNYIATAEL